MANNTTFTSQTGSVGTSFLPFLVNNRNPSSALTTGSNYLNASASKDVYVSEVQGNLLSHLISSTNGNIGLQTWNGNGNLGQVLGGKSINILVDGALLNIGTIAGPSGSGSAYKAPSPNNVSLRVAAPGGALTVSQLSVFQSLTTAADVTNLNAVTATNLSNSTLLNARQTNALQVSMTGSEGGIAAILNANIAPCVSCSVVNPVIFNQYWTQTGAINASVDWLEFANVIIGNSAQIDNSYLNVKVASVNNRNRDNSWQMLIVGDEVQTSHSPDSITALLLNPKKRYQWPVPPNQIFQYLWKYLNF